MHNLVGRASATLETFGGTVTVAEAVDLPEGASPRNQNVDFNVGSAFTRQGLINPFAYENAAAGPSPGAIAIDAGLGWSNPSNVLSDSGFALTNLIGNTGFGAAAASITQSGTGPNSWSFLENMILPGPGVAGVIPNNGYTAQIVVQTSGIPANTPISGIVVSFYAYTSYSGDGSPASASFSFGSANKVQAAGGASAPQPYSLGSATDTWGTSFTGASLNSGITLSVTPVNGTADSLLMYGVTVTVYYAMSTSDPIDIEEFAFSVPSSSTPQGFKISVLGYATSPATLNVQMIKDGSPIGSVESVPLNVGSPTTVKLGGINDLFGAGWSYSDLNNTAFGIRLTATSAAASQVSLGYTTLTAYFTPQQENFNYITTFEDDFGNIKNIALDDTGQFFTEDLTNNPGVLTSLFSGPPAGSFASSFTADSRQYIAISDLLQGSYPPQQYTGTWNDRVSQVGPGAAPIFTAITSGTSGTDTFAISTITQPAVQVNTYSYFLQSTGPGSTTAGNVVTVYYADSTNDTADQDLVAAFNSGNPVYVYMSFTGGPVTQGPYTVQVTSVNEGQPPGQPRQFYYFTYNVTTSAYTYYQGSGHPGYTATYQQSLATMTMDVPVPGLTIGNIVTLAGSSVTGYNNQWTITQTPNSGSFTITETAVSGGIATYTYALITGSVPTAGQLVTITGTNNANGQLNLVNAVIVTASGGSSGEFTVNVSFSDFATSSEEGQATTAGTVFTFDPGAALAGSTTDPIYGNATGGTITFEGNGQITAAGTRQGTVFFITRNGYYTAPAPPVTFSCPGNTLSIQASNLPIGPPNVIARGVAFTEAGAFGVPGASFYWLPQPEQYIVQNVTYTATATKINDNTSTTATFSFLDATLLNSEEIDIQGSDLFNLGEIGNAAWCTQYAGRSVWGRVQTKVQNFLNLTFDGGYIANPGGNLLPLGWNLDNSTTAVSPTLLVSPVFGNSYYIHNTSGSTQAQLDMITQSAYQDYNKVAILQNQTAYSVRVTARTPSSATGGDLVVDLTTYDSGTGYGKTYGVFTLSLASMGSAMTTYAGTLLTTDTLNIPSDLVLRVFGSNLPNGADIEIDRIEIFPTTQPTNLTQLVLSYQNDPESFDQVTGGIDTTTVNTQPASGAFIMHDELYVVKESSLGYVSDTPNQEPANWNPYKEVSNVAGACGINAYDVGEEWAVMGCQNGLFLFNGGAPVPIQLEIPDIWQAINWKYGHTICIRNDVANRKIFCAIPLPTPNPWMNDATVNANPTEPNVILMLNYSGIGNIEQLMEAASLKVTMTGKLAVTDLRRKWSLWTVPTPYMGVIKRSELAAEMMFCNGTASSKIYYLGSDETGNDDGVDFTSSYCTYGFVDSNKEAENPMLGQHNKRYAYYDLLVSGSGTANLEFFQNVLEAPYPFDVPGGIALSNPAANDVEGPLDELSQRLFAEISITGGWFDLSRLTLVGAADKWSKIRGF